MSDLTADQETPEYKVSVARMVEETLKFVAEQHKLEAERRKLDAEAEKFNRERWVPLIVALAAVVGGFSGLLVSLLRLGNR